MNKSYQVPSVHKAIDILQFIQTSKTVTFKELTEYLHLAPSTCYNILNTLVERGFVKKDPITSKYSLGSSLMQLGLHAYREVNLRDITRPVLEQLHSVFDETVYLTTLSDTANEGMVIDKIDGSHSIIALRQIGDRVPLYASSTGKSILSGFTKGQLDTYLESIHLVSYSENTITSKESLVSEIRKIQQLGYAITRNDLNDGASAVSAPIRDYAHKVIAAISVAGPVDRMEDKILKIIPSVKRAALEISQELGFANS